MALLADDRAQSIQVGAVLLFAILILAFSTYQAVIVPEQNRRVEFDHNQEVQSQLSELRDAVLATQDGGAARSTTVDLGTRYPSRALAMNPGSPSGTLRTVGTTDPLFNLTIANATATTVETGDYWDGSPRHFDTGAIAYEPVYHNYDDAPTTAYEHTVLYNDFSADSLVLANQSFIRGTTISLVTLNGSLQRTSSTATTVDVRSLSASDRTIRIDDLSDSDPVTLNFTSQLSVERWRTILSGQGDVVESVEGYPSAAGEDFTAVRVTLHTNHTYDLELTRAGVGTGLSGTDPAYLTDVSGGGSVAAGNNEEITLEVRDPYNNPVPGVTVNGSVGSGGSLVSDGANGRETTDSAGQVTFTYQSAGAPTGTHLVNFTMNDSAVLSTPFDASVPKNVSVGVTVTTATGGEGGAGAYEVNWTNPDDESANAGAVLSSCGTESCRWDVGASGDSTLTLNATTVDPAFEGVDLDFAVDNTTVGTVSPGSATTGADGAATTTLSAEANGTVNVLASGDDDSAVISIDVVNAAAEDLVYNGDASADMPGYDGIGQRAMVGFTVSNEYSGSVVITDVTFNGSSINPSGQIAEGQGGDVHEVWIDTNGDGTSDGDVDTFFDPIQEGETEPLGSPVTMPAGTSAEVRLYHFEQSSSENPVDMVGEDATVTLHYTDPSGDSQTTTIQMTSIPD